MQPTYAPLAAEVGAEATFNTGRYYGPEGQPVTAKVISEVPEADRLLPSCPEWVVEFNDHARRIRGTVKVIASTYISQSEIMEEYDAGRYELN